MEERGAGSALLRWRAKHRGTPKDSAVVLHYRCWDRAIVASAGTGVLRNLGVFSTLIARATLREASSLPSL